MHPPGRDLLPTDQKWINDNIAPKREGHTGEAIHKAQEAPRKASRKKRR